MKILFYLPTNESIIKFITKTNWGANSCKFDNITTTDIWHLLFVY